MEQQPRWSTAARWFAENPPYYAAHAVRAGASPPRPRLPPPAQVHLPFMLYISRHAISSQRIEFTPSHSYSSTVRMRLTSPIKCRTQNSGLDFLFQMQTDGKILRFATKHQSNIIGKCALNKVPPFQTKCSLNKAPVSNKNHKNSSLSRAQWLSGLQQELEGRLRMQNNAFDKSGAVCSLAVPATQMW